MKDVEELVPLRMPEPAPEPAAAADTADTELTGDDEERTDNPDDGQLSLFE